MVELQFGETLKVHGSPADMAYYTVVLLYLMKYKTDKDAEDDARKELELFEKFGNMTFEELLKRERDEEE